LHGCIERFVPRDTVRVMRATREMRCECDRLHDMRMVMVLKRAIDDGSAVTMRAGGRRMLETGTRRRAPPMRPASAVSWAVQLSAESVRHQLPAISLRFRIRKQKPQATSHKREAGSGKPEAGSRKREAVSSRLSASVLNSKSQGGRPPPARAAATKHFPASDSLATQPSIKAIHSGSGRSAEGGR
jgi:hypothetical protein